MMRPLFGMWCLLAACTLATAASDGESVLVLYNSNSPESKELAQYYALKRRVPKAQVFGFDLPDSEAISRKQFRDQLQRPLLRKIEREKWLQWRADSRRNANPVDPSALPQEAKIRYLVLSYHVPLRILEDARISEPEMEKIPSKLRKNEAAVDAELALLPMGDEWPLYGPIGNPVAGTTNAAALTPTNGVLMVARLDGPSASVVRGLIDKALQADREGLWGRAYFDARGLTNGNNQLGDDWIKGAAEVTRRMGFETILDEKEERFPVSFPMSQIAFYAGWYEHDGQVSGPFTRSNVEFMPGAFAYHLHSFSAQTVRSSVQGWAGPLLDKGATFTMGCVHEPFLGFTPNLTVFFHRLIYLGFSFGEAAYASQPFLSWQITVIGDPLARPFRDKPQTQHDELLRTKGPLLEWSHLKVVNINLATGLPAPDLIGYLEETPETRQSAVLLEKLGELYSLRARFPEAIETYRQAIKLAASPQQRIRLSLALGGILEFSGRLDEAYETYQEFLKSFPDYPDLLTIYRKLVPLSDQLKKASDHEQYQREIERLSGSAGKS